MSMASDLKKLDDELNNLIVAGKLLEAFERFYAADVAMQENTDAAMVGKAANLAREQGFVGALDWDHTRFEHLAQAVGDGVTMNEWRLKMTFRNGPAMDQQQVSVRRWRGDKVAGERFYHK
jgi:hypothetical protein